MSSSRLPANCQALFGGSLPKLTPMKKSKNPDLWPHGYPDYRFSSSPNAKSGKIFAD
jgi:hypothetical protein